MRIIIFAILENGLSNKMGVVVSMKKRNCKQEVASKQSKGKEFVLPCGRDGEEGIIN